MTCIPILVRMFGDESKISEIRNKISLNYEIRAMRQKQSNGMSSILRIKKRDLQTIFFYHSLIPLIMHSIIPSLLYQTSRKNPLVYKLGVKPGFFVWYQASIHLKIVAIIALC